MDVLNNARAYISEFFKLSNRVSRLRSATVNAHKTHTDNRGNNYYNSITDAQNEKYNNNNDDKINEGRLVRYVSEM